MTDNMLTPDGWALKEYMDEEPARRNAVLEEAIAAVEHLSEQCGDLLDSEEMEEAKMQHRLHRQAYIQVLRRLESLREGAYGWPAVRPERLQMLLLDRVESFLQNPAGEETRAKLGLDDSSHMIAWVKEQLVANANVRSNFLLL